MLLVLLLTRGDEANGPKIAHRFLGHDESRVSTSGHLAFHPGEVLARVPAGSSAWAGCQPGEWGCLPESTGIILSRSSARNSPVGETLCRQPRCTVGWPSAGLAFVWRRPRLHNVSVRLLSLDDHGLDRARVMVNIGAVIWVFPITCVPLPPGVPWAVVGCWDEAREPRLPQVRSHGGKPGASQALWAAIGPPRWPRSKLLLHGNGADVRRPPAPPRC